MNSKNHQQELIDAAWPYWEAEAEIPYRFVANKPTREDYITYSALRRLQGAELGHRLRAVQGLCLQPA